MNPFRKRNATASTEAPAGERHCRACGGSLADDQVACLECGAVEGATGGKGPPGGLSPVQEESEE